MLVQIVTENGVKKLKPLTADAGAGAPVGFIAPFYKKGNYSGWLYLDGSTFDETKYPLLYAYLGTNVLPDLRELGLKGAEKNTTYIFDSTETDPRTGQAGTQNHDVFAQGEFKDDQLQDHRHSVNRHDGGGGANSTSVTNYHNDTVQTTGTVAEARCGTVTRGKSFGVFYYIKATSGLTEGQQDNVVAQLKGLLKTVEYTGTTGGDGMLWGAFSGIDVTKVLSVLVKSDTGHNTSAIISNASSSPTAYGIRIVHFQNNSYTSEANKQVTVSITYLDY